VSVNGLPGILQESDTRWLLRVETPNGTVLIDAPDQLSQAETLSVAESIPAVGAPVQPSPPSGNDLRDELNGDWIRSLLPDGTSAVDYDPAGDAQIGLTVIGRDGTQFNLIATPDTNVAVPPFANDTISIDGVDVVLTIPEASQAVAGFVCGHISWQLVGRDQAPRDLITETARAIISGLEC